MLSLILPPVKPQHYRPDIDGLRAIAIVSVVLFHTFPTMLPGGFVGVDVFFVISGYLISTIIFRAFDKGSFSFLDFYARRIRRIFPALSLLLFGVILLGAFALTPEEFKNLGKQVIYGSAFGENIFLIRHSGGYWDTATEMKPLMHLWTLAVEEQYYIFYPFLCWILWKLKRGVLPTLCLLWIVSFGFDIYQSQSSPIIAFFSLHTRFWELCTGCILAAFSTSREYKGKLKSIIYSNLNRLTIMTRSTLFPRKFNEFGSLLGLGLIVAGITFASGEEKLRSLLLLLPVFGTVLIISFRDSWLNKKILSSAPFVFIGLISYTWYLWHWPLLSIARNMNGGKLPSYWICFLLLLIGLLLSLFSYFIIETPIRRKKITKKISISLTACVVCCALLGLSVQGADGFPSRLGDDAATARSSSNTFPKRNEYAQIKYGCPKNLDFCWAPEGSLPSIALIGDSHAHHLAFGLRKNLNKPFVLLGQLGTPPVKKLISLNYEKAGKKPLMEEVLDTVIEDRNIKTVILSARWNQFVNYKKELYQLSGYKNDDSLITLEHLLSESIEELVRNKKNVIVLLDTPQIFLDPKNCVKSRPIQLKSGSCNFKEDLKRINEDKINEMILRVVKKYPSVKVVNASKGVCKEGICFVGDGKSLYYYDNNHLTNLGSDLVAKAVLKQLKF